MGQGGGGGGGGGAFALANYILFGKHAQLPNKDVPSVLYRGLLFAVFFCLQCSLLEVH